MVTILLSIAFALKGFAATGYFRADSNCVRAYDYVYALQFEKAREQLKHYKQSHPDNLIPLHIENTIDFLSLFISEDDGQYAQLMDNKGVRLRKIQSLAPKDDPYVRYVQADIILQWAFVRMKFGDYFTVAKEIYQAYDLLELNIKEYPDFHLNKKGMGILHALVGTIPDNYQWLVRMIGMQGSIARGVEELYSFYAYAEKKEGTYLQVEAFFYQSFLSTNLLTDEKRWMKLEAKGREMLPKDNPLVIFARVALLRKLGKNEEIIRLLENRKIRSGQYPFYYLDFILGEAYLYKMDKKAISAFEQYVKCFKGRHYIKAAWLRLAWAYLLIEGNEKQYAHAMNNIPNYGRSDVGDDQYALKQSEKESLPVLPLLKARLLFDGGYYAPSLAVLADFQPSLQKQKAAYVECYYRKARNYHELKRYQEALSAYLITIREGKTLGEYYAANAALMMGMIYEKQGKNKQAEASYKQCLAMPDCSYKSGIDQKAKAGLERLRD